MSVPPSPTGVEQGVDWHRLHKVTPLLNAWRVAAAILVIFVWQYADTVGDLNLTAGMTLLIAVGVIVVGALIGLGYSALAWRMTTYGIGRESVYLHSGVLFRQQRHVRIDRLQTVEVTQPLVARLFGFASLKVEAAGGTGSNLTLAYLTEAQAQALRNEILARAAGVSATPAPDGAPTVAAQAAPEREVLALTPPRLIGSLALSIGLIVIALGAIGIVVAAVVTQSLNVLAGIGPAALGSLVYFWGRFSGEFAFRVAASPDGIRIRQGLLEAKARTVPPGRVQAVKISQPLLWRLKGWWRIHVNIAGYGAEETVGNVLFPVATTEEVGRVLYLVLPDLGHERPLDLLAAAMSGKDQHEGFVTTPRRARVLDWLTWRRTGFRVTETAILLRTGRLWRQLVIVPHERTQSLALQQGPVERRFDLMTFNLHSTPGPIVPSVHHIDSAVAKALLVEQADRARRARLAAGPERWMRETRPAAPSEGGGAAGGGAAGAGGAHGAPFGGVLPNAGVPGAGLPGAGVPPQGGVPA